MMVKLFSSAVNSESPKKKLKKAFQKTASEIDVSLYSCEGCHGVGRRWKKPEALVKFYSLSKFSTVL